MTTSASNGHPASDGRPTKALSLPARPPPFAADIHDLYVDERPPPKAPWSAARQALQDRINELPLVQALRHRKDKFHEFQSVWELKGDVRDNHLLLGSLSGQNQLPVYPITFRHLKEDDPFSFVTDGDENTVESPQGQLQQGQTNGGDTQAELPSYVDMLMSNQTDTAMTQIMYVGRALCGHDDIIHGGLLATLLDDAYARLGFSFLPGHLGFTANLNINYRCPVPADIMIVIKIELVKYEGRKVYLSARITSLDGKFLFVDSTTLFVAPKVAPVSSLNTRNGEKPVVSKGEVKRQEENGGGVPNAAE
ncbi:hypothetical protein IWQ60_003960 [Tieghemiomyces parasiticus]|uniref:Thioesterase domain-containing protein n=1 Tax=Tieghemiomyces parasiticus TaxID=78921 RepID=A0A9W8ACA1_9FUNG|nr:hypothetical protein IWQ60_003960 [Tieghemiomyces parasiticus]